MTRRVVFGIGIALCVVVYAVGIIGLATTPHANAIPTPGRAVVAGVIAMFSTLGFFIIGFIQSATTSD